MKLKEGPARLLNVESNDKDVAEAEGNDEDVDKVNRDAVHIPDWDPFEGVRAPNGFMFVGKVAFIVFGPSSRYFDPILRMGYESSGETTAASIAGGRREIRKLTENRATNDCAYGNDRGMTMETKLQCGMIAQTEDKAEHRRHELDVVRLSKLIESTEKQIDLKMKMAEKFGEEYHAQLMMSINLLMEKLERLNKELEKSGRGATKQNPIIGSVLRQAAKAMGLPKNDEDSDNDDFVSSVLHGTD